MTTVNSSLRKSRAMLKLSTTVERRQRRAERSCWFEGGRSDDFWKNVSSGKLSAGEWKKNFRMDEQSFNELVQELEPYISPLSASPNYRKLSADVKLAITLYYLADTGSFKQTANTFGVSRPTLSVVLNDVCRAELLSTSDQN
eukprot:scpid36435/ scgid23911/ 